MAEDQSINYYSCRTRGIQGLQTNVKVTAKNEERNKISLLNHNLEDD